MYYWNTNELRKNLQDLRLHKSVRFPNIWKVPGRSHNSAIEWVTTLYRIVAQQDKTLQKEVKGKCEDDMGIPGD